VTPDARFKAKPKMHQIRFPLGLRPRTRLGSLQRSPDPLAVFRKPTSKGRDDGRGGKGKGRVREGKVEEGWPPNWGVWIRQ